MSNVPETSPAKPNATWIAWFVLIGFGLLWGLTFSLMKFAIDTGAHPIGLSFWNALLGAIGLLAINAVRRTPIPLAPRYLKFYTICSILGTSVSGTAYYYAAIHLPAGVLAITIATVPILTFVGTSLLGIDRWSGLRAAGVALGLIAVALIVLPDSALPDRRAAIWILAALLSALCYTVENIYLTLRRPKEIDPFTLLIGMFTIAAIMMLPIVYLAGAHVPLTFPPGKLEWLIIAMCVINASAYGAFIYLVGIAGPVFASQMGYLVTLSGVGWGIVLYSESHSGWIWAALAVMIAGLALVQPREEQS